MCLRLDVFTNELTTCWIKGDLARGVDKLATANGLAVRANSCRSLACADLRALHSYYFPGDKMTVVIILHGLSRMNSEKRENNIKLIRLAWHVTVCAAPSAECRPAV